MYFKINNYLKPPKIIIYHLPSSRALLLHTPPLKYHLISATKQTVSPMTAISVEAVLLEMKLSPICD